MYSMRQTPLPGRGINMGQPDIDRAMLPKQFEFGSHHKKIPGCSGFPSCPLLPQLSCSAGPASPYQARIPHLHGGQPRGAENLLFAPLGINQKREHCSFMKALACVKRGRTWSQKRRLIDTEHRLNAELFHNNSPHSVLKSGGIK